MQMHKQSTQFDPNQYISNKHYKEVAQKKVYFFSAPLRLQRIRLHLQRYQLNVHYIPGRDIPVAKIPDYTYSYPKLRQKWKPIVVTHTVTVTHISCV